MESLKGTGYSKIVEQLEADKLSEANNNNLIDKAWQWIEAYIRNGSCTEEYVDRQKELFYKAMSR